VVGAKTQLPSPRRLYLGRQAAKPLTLPIQRALAFRSTRATDVGCLKYRRTSCRTARHDTDSGERGLLRILSRTALAGTNGGGVAMSRAPFPGPPRLFGGGVSAHPT
jgi:hypothetical protein